MRYISWILTIPLTLIVVSFALSNRQPVTLSLWPLPFELQAPLYLAVLVAVLLAFLTGGLVAWLSGHRHRRLARRRALELQALSAELQQLRDKQARMDEAARRQSEAARRHAAELASGRIAQLEHQANSSPRSGAA